MTRSIPLRLDSTRDRAESCAVLRPTYTAEIDETRHRVDVWTSPLMKKALRETQTLRARWL